MAQEQLLRLRYKGKVVGYEWKLPLISALSLVGVEVDGIEEVKDYVVVLQSYDMKAWRWEYVLKIKYTSFDHSLKQGDEWFFEGDEVEIVGTQYRGALAFDRVGWFVIRNEKSNMEVCTNDTLTLIRRAE